MTSLQTTPAQHRFPFDEPAPQVHFIDRDKSLPRTPELQQFLFQYSEIKALRLCSKRFQCGRPICPWCSGRRATDTRSKVGQVAKGRPVVIDFTTTTGSAAKLPDAWNAQQAVVALFTHNGWLTSRTAAWLRETEITHDVPGWHVHTNWIIFPKTRNEQEMEALGNDAVGRWVDMADRAGISAAKEGTKIMIRRDVHTRISYGTKGVMTDSARSGRTLAEILAGYERGDADDADLWHEVEAFFGSGIRRRWRATGGAFRAKK